MEFDRRQFLMRTGTAVGALVFAGVVLPRAADR